jgi:hypothetical protein
MVAKRDMSLILEGDERLYEVGFGPSNDFPGLARSGLSVNPGLAWNPFELPTTRNRYTAKSESSVKIRLGPMSSATPTRLPAARLIGVSEAFSTSERDRVTVRPDTTATHLSRAESQDGDDRPLDLSQDGLILEMEFEGFL